MDSYKETELATEPAPKTTCDDNQDDVVASNGDSSAGPSSRPPLPQSTKQELSPQQMLRQSRVDLLATPPVPLRMKLRSRAGQEADRMSMVTNLSRAGSFKVKGLLPRFGRKRRRDLAGSPEMDPDTMSIGSSYSTASGLSTASTLTAGGAGRRKLRGLKTMKSTLRQVIKGPRHHMQSEMEIVESPCKKPKMDVPIYRPPQKQPARRKEQRRWVDTMDRSVDTLSKELVKRQEAIFEIIEHARAMQEDMKNVEVHYIGPMKNLGYITGDEKTVLFAGVPICLSFSEDVVEKLELLRSRDDGTIDCIGNTLSLCLPKLRQLVPCCARLAAAKELYDQKLAEPVVAAFLELCQQSPFSRKRSLWDFLDSQRSGLLKYPLLLKEVMKTTSDDHPDTPGLKKVLEELEAFITKLDKLTGEVTCQRTLEKLVFAHKERCSLVDSSQALLFSGLLKLSQGGHHVQVFLFDRALVVAQPASGSDGLYNVTYQPMSTSQIAVETANTYDGKSASASPGTSPRSSLRRRSGDGNGHSFKVTRMGLTYDSLPGKQIGAFTFTANDVHDKKAWVSALETAVAQAPPVYQFRSLKQTSC